METEVLVLGAGPAGSSTAYFLAERGVQVSLVDTCTFPRQKICGDGVGPAAVRVLQKMGLLVDTEASTGRYLRFSGVHIFASDGSSVRLHYPFRPKGGGPRHGYVIPRYDLDQQLVQRAVDAGAAFLPGLRAVEPLYAAGRVAGYRVQERGQSTNIGARLLVVATGAHLGTVRALGLYQSSNVTKLAMRAYYALPSDSGTDPYLQIHLDRNLLPYYGWVFPVGARTLNVGVGADRSERGESHLRPAFECFVDRNPRVREQLVGAKQLDRPRGWPMRTGFLHRRTYDDGVLAVGEAAGLVDPLTGEGISFALQSGALAAEAAYEALAEGNFSSAKLSAYGRALHRRYAAYFRYTQRLRSRVRDPGLADVLVALAREAKKAGAARWAPGELGSLLWFAFQKRQVLGLAPYLVYRLLRARAISIEV